ncbi:MAG: hypothetical protein AB1778_02810 [Candidatus Bipolaricaulota bacterium]
MVFRRIVLMGVLSLGFVALALTAAGTWRDKVAPSVLRWIDNGTTEERTVLVSVLGISSTDVQHEAYAATSHRAWLSGGREAASQVAQDAVVENTLALLRADGMAWEIGLAPIYGLGLLVARGAGSQIRALAQRNDVLQVLDGMACTPTPPVPEGASSSEIALAAPKDLLAFSSVAAGDFWSWMSSLGWRYVSRGDIVTSEDPEAPLTLSPSPILMDTSSVEIVGLALADADRLALEQSGMTLTGALADSSWAEATSVSVSVSQLAGLLEAMEQTGADGTAMASVKVDGAIHPVYVLVRTATGAGWASVGLPPSGTSTTENRLPRGSAPGMASASRGSYGDRILVEWKPAAGASTYEVLRAERAGGAYEPVAVASGLSFQDRDVETCTPYSYAIRSLNSGALGLETVSTPGYVGLVPMPPTRIWTDGGTQAATVIVQWAPVEGATSYRLMRTQPMSDQPRVPAQQYDVYSGPEALFVDTDVVVGQTYNYRVFAENGCGKSELSPQAQGMAFYDLPPDPTRLSPPSWFDATRGRPYGLVMVSWSTVRGAESYRVLRATSYRGTYEPVIETDSTSWEDRDVVLCGDYWYRVQALAGEEESAPSKTIYGSYGYRPAAPEGVRASMGTYTNSIEVTWLPMEDTEVYNVSRAPAREGPFATIATGITETRYVDEGLEPGQEFWYKVKASNPCGCSGDSGAVYGATTPR